MAEQPQIASGGPGLPGHPELEDLAALADGMLSRTDAARVRAHVDSCEECYEVFAETLHLMEELQGEEEDPAGDVAAFPFDERRKAWPGWATAAVAALLVVGVGVGLWYRNSATELAMSSLVSPLAGKVPGLDRVIWGERTRGGSSPQGENLEFKVGVETANLQMALEANDWQAADAAAATLNGLLKDLDAASAGFYGKLHTDRPPQVAFKDLARRAEEKADALRESIALQGVKIDLGAWAEAGRFAAIAQKPAFFQKKTARHLLERFPKEGVDLPPEVKNALETLDGARSKAELSPQDYRTLQSAFEQILDHYYPQGHPIS